MSNKFYAGQKDYIQKLNEMDDTLGSHLNAAEQIMLGYANTATGAVSQAQTAARQALSVVQQDLSGAERVALHRSPNAIVAAIRYNVADDSDPFWPERMGDKSWMVEALNGAWLAWNESELYARTAGATKGAELVADSSFNSPAAWVVDAGISIVGGAAVYDGAAHGNNLVPVSAPAFTSGKMYEVLVDVIEYTSGNLTMYQNWTTGSTNQVKASFAPGKGVWRWVFSPTSNGTGFTLQADAASKGALKLSVGSISVREVTALNTKSGDYYQLSTDGKNYRLWKNIVVDSENKAQVAGTGLATATTFSGLTHGTGMAFGYNGTTTSTWLGGVPTQNGVSYRLSVYVRMDDGSAPSFANSGVTNAANDFAMVIANGIQESPLNWQVTDLGGGLYKVSARGTATSASSVNGIYKYATNSSRTFKASGLMLEQIVNGDSVTPSTYEMKDVGVGSQSEVFRGNKAKFPRQAAIVAEASRVVIYDLTEPGNPMWMVFTSALTKGIVSWANNTPGLSSVSAREGRMFIGSSSGGNNSVIDFAADRMTLVHSNSFTPTNTRIADRHNLGSSGGSNYMLAPGGIVIGNAAVNAVAMTTVPDAPTDPATGLRVPTIAVGTGGGVSIIQNSGVVVNSVNTGNFTAVSLVKETLIASAGSANAFYAIKPNALGASFALTTIAYNAPPYANPSNSLGAPTVQSHAGRDTFAVRAGPRMAMVRLNESDHAKSMTAHILDTYNTGWMPGDIRRAILCDTLSGTADGTNLATGDSANFTVGIGDWYAGTSATLAAVGGELRVTQTAINGRGVLAFPTTPGLLYAVSADVRLVSGTGANVGISSVADGMNTATFSMANTTSPTFVRMTSYRVAEGSFLYAVAGINSGGSNEMAFDNFVVSEVISDRSYKNKPANVYGTLSRTAVATAAQLVAYSGFSGSNHLREAYSSDLDFGTGSYRVSTWASVPTITTSMFPAHSADLITNGAFDTDTGWTKGTNWTISGGTANHASGAASSMLQDIGAVSGRFYKVTWTVSNSTSGGTSSYVGGASGTTVLGNGTYTQIVRAVGQSTVGISCSTVFDGSIDNVSVVNVGAARIAERSAASGPRWTLGVNPDGTFVGEAFDGTTTRTVTSAASYSGVGYVKATMEYSTSGTLSLRVNGRQVAATTGAPLLSMNSRYNQFVRTEGQLEDAQWSKVEMTASGNVVTGSATSGVVKVIRQANATATGTATYVQRMRLKMGTQRYVQFLVINDGAIHVNFDLQGGTYSVGGTRAASASVSMTAVTGGGFDVSFTYTSDQPTANMSGSVVIIDDMAAVRSATTTAVNTTFELSRAERMPATLASLPYQRVGADTDFDFQAPLTIGNNFALTGPFPGSITMVRIGATLVTEDAAAWSYDQEKQMFREGAQITLPDAGALVDMAYDSRNGTLLVASAANESQFTGLIRTSTSAAAAGSITKIAGSGGTKLIARSTTNPGVDLSMPAQNLKEELATSRKTPVGASDLVDLDWTGGFTANISNVSNGTNQFASVTGFSAPAQTTVVGAQFTSASGVAAGSVIASMAPSGAFVPHVSSLPFTAVVTGAAIAFIDFILPLGMEAKQVLVNGVAKQEGSTKDYVRRYDGHRETIRFNVAPGSTAWVQIKAVRKV